MTGSPSSLASTHAGLRVLDLSSNLAGPLAAMILGDLGADVIKVERPGRGDDTRGLPPRWGGEATVFLSVNRSKRSVTLELATPDGREALLRLAESADVLIESFGPGVAERLGLGFEDLRQSSPGIVYCSVSAFGGGPLGRRLPGYDAMIQAFSGMMSITGHPGSPPARVAPSAVDLSTGLWLVIAIQSALARRARGEDVPHLQIALVDSAFMLMCHQVLGFLATGQVPGPLGSAAPSTTPNGAFHAADGWLVVATANDAQFRRLCQALGVEDLGDDPRFATIERRVAERDALQTLLAARFAQETVAVWIERLHAAKVPVGRVHDLREALEHPLSTERGLLVDREPAHPADDLQQLRLPIDPDGACVRSWPPRLGEHTAEVLREAGLAEAEIAGAVGQPQVAPAVE